MKDVAPQTVHLRDYTPFSHLIDSVDLTFRLSGSATRVLSTIRFRPKPGAPDQAFFLHGVGLTPISTKIDGRDVTVTERGEGITCDVPDGPFIWEAEVEIDPAGNTALEGLYMSNGMYCTQCEAEGFRKITYYPDRPDVMAVFTVRIESDLPVLLSNGNGTEQGKGYAVWHDPWPKPSYLFALVAGDLVAHPGQFTTMSGRDVALNIWVRPGDITKCAFGMKALKASMSWDETVYGREYDLNIFNIVAVDDFNMGAMENKGLNIFNSSCVLASPTTATDADFERIEAIIAHEYFHNWTGNRITCRDWFQLCLKEGLTVFRDQEFTGDMRSHAVKRIDDAQVMRNVQFREDNGPLAHPVRPESFVEINNFYTVTVYEKGAEIIGMLKRLVGDQAYRKALDLYFDRHDGQACTIEDWLAVFTEATGRDLTQFKRWYTQAGTPRIKVEEDWTEGTYTLTFRQSTPPTPGQAEKAPVVIPLAVGLIGQDGAEISPTQIVALTDETTTISFDGLKDRPVPSLLRDFSAPVIVERDASTDELALLLAHDTDPFARWDAGTRLSRHILMTMAERRPADPQPWLDGIRTLVQDDQLDPAFRARMMALPTQDALAEALANAGRIPDPQAIHTAHERLRTQLSDHLADIAPGLRAKMATPGPFSPDAESAGKRAFANALLTLITRQDDGDAAAAQFADADNMTQQISALSALLKNGKGAAQLARFEAQWNSDRLVMDKWFALQIGASAPKHTVATVNRLTDHAAFDLRNPNRVRAVLGAMAGHLAGFHTPGGAGYDLLADWLIQLDRVNPQTAARLSNAFATWRRYDPDRQGQMRQAMDRIRETPGLSRDTGEMLDRILG
ncbi:MAG: aminopeptidase N [Paracoccaceae bacterium]